MKEQYVGDISDFHKYRLLRFLSDGGRTKIGMCWMLTPPDGRRDGNRLRYLSQPQRWRKLDPTIFDLLNATTAHGVTSRIARIEDGGVLPGAMYQRDMIPDNVAARLDFMKTMWQRFKSADLVFFDPDNGIERSKPKGHKASSKYIYWDEIEETYQRGHSVLVYQHFSREPRQAFIEKQCRELAKRLALQNVWVFRTSHVVFLLAVHQRHTVRFRSVLENAASQLVEGINVYSGARERERRELVLPSGENNVHKWIGPFTVRDLLAHAIDSSIPLPPESGSAYLISRYSWRSYPTDRCMPLYIGSNTGRSARFRTRLGDLIADLFGFFGKETGHHSGGQSLHAWCRQHQINPLKLHIAWVDGCSCHRCLEVELFRELSPQLNRVVPSACAVHGKDIIWQSQERDAVLSNR